MIKVTDQILAEMVQAIVNTAHPDRIILFGSAAWGASGPDSDMDFLVVEKEPFGPGRSRRREIHRIRSALSRFRVPKDIVVYSTDEVEKWRHSINHIIAS
jgi:predicted nucleotidyltransferase